VAAKRSHKLHRPLLNRPGCRRTGPSLFSRAASAGGLFFSRCATPSFLEGDHRQHPLSESFGRSQFSGGVVWVQRERRFVSFCRLPFKFSRPPPLDSVYYSGATSLSPYDSLVALGRMPALSRHSF
jgi:hypothetical protein